MRHARSVRIAKTGYIAASLLYCLLGILMIVKPSLSISVIGTTMGAAMIAFGLVKLWGYFSKDLYQLAFQHDLAFGMLMVALGILILVKPNQMTRSLCVIIGIATLADGLLKIQTSLDAKTFGLASWVVILLMALIACLLGALLIFRAEGSAFVFVALIGVAILAQGILNLMTAVFTVKVINRERGSAIDMTDDEKK